MWLDDTRMVRILLWVADNGSVCTNRECDMQAALDGVDPVIGTRELAEFIGTPEATLRYWRHTGRGPKSFRVGRRIVYRRSVVVAWLDEQAENDPSAHRPLR